MQHRRIDPPQHPDDDGLGLLDLIGKQVGGEHGRDGERRQQRANQGVTVGSRHRAEDLALDPLHREQWNERGDRDGRGKENRLIDLQGADQNEPQPVGPRQRMDRLPAACRIGAPLLLCKLRQQRLPLLRPRLKVPEDILDQDDRRIDDDAEVDGADRQKIRVLAAQDQNNDAEEQGERNVDADDDGAAQIAEEDPLHEEDQQATEDEVVQDGMGGDRHQDRAVVKRNELHPRRQRPVAIDLIDLGLDARHHVVGVQRPVHDHDGRDHIVFVVAAGLAEPRHVADIDLGDVLDRHRHAVRLRQHDFLDVADPVTLGQIGIAAVVQQTDAADVDRLLAEIDGAAAHIDIGVADRIDHLGQGDAVGIELVEIDLDLEFLGGAAPGVDLDDAWDG